MYTLRIIDQTKVGGEKRRNVFLGNEYSLLLNKFLREASEPQKEHHNIFKKAVMEYYGVSEGDEFPIDETLVGFVYGNDKIYPIHSYEVVYIVGSEGQTIERVYGQYNKY